MTLSVSSFSQIKNRVENQDGRQEPKDEKRTTDFGSVPVQNSSSTRSLCVGGNNKLPKRSLLVLILSVLPTSDKKREGPERMKDSGLMSP